MDSKGLSGRFTLTLIAAALSTAASATMTETTLHAFSSAEGQPTTHGPAVVVGTDGNYYGALTGGSSGNGAIYRLTPAGDFTIIYSFTGGADGGQPNALTLGNDGKLYGTTSAGGGKGLGTAFRIGTDGTFTTLHTFHGYDGRFPNSGLVQGSDGNFYGTTLSGGKFAGCLLYFQDHKYIGCGLVYRMTPKGYVKVLHKFDVRNGDGWIPNGVMQASDGFLYGTTQNSGIEGGGVIFKLPVDGSSYQILFGLNGSVGNAPTAPPTEGSDGNFYGSTVLGGVGAGNVYTFTPSGTYTSLYSFQADVAPFGGLAQNSQNGRFYGTTGYQLYNGIVYSIAPSGAYAVEYSFSGGNDGAQPAATLVPANADGSTLIGTTTAGASGNGAVVKLQLQ